jgi:hypothetical protein
MELATALFYLSSLPGMQWYDPRERFIAEFMAKRGDYNVFHNFYRELVQALYDTGATRYVFCVNVDAVIAALLLAVLCMALPKNCSALEHRTVQASLTIANLPTMPKALDIDPPATSLGEMPGADIRKVIAID